MVVWSKKGICLSLRPMPGSGAMVFLLLSVLFLGVAPLYCENSLAAGVSEILRNRIEAAGSPPQIVVGKELIHASLRLPVFYERRVYEPAWSSKNGVRPDAFSLVRALKAAGEEGLCPYEYHLAVIEKLLAAVERNNGQNLRARRMVDLDLLLTDAFLVYASHLLAGRVNPETIDPEWHANRREADLSTVLQEALDAGQVEEGLAALLPSAEGYAALKKALKHYREIASQGGWPVVQDGPKLEIGMRDKRVAQIRERLTASGDMVEQKSEASPDYFDGALDEAVVQFQIRHGLEVDGVVGRNTLAALNVPVAERARQIEMNLERWRWLPQDLGERYVLVNIAKFELDVVEGNEVVLSMPVVVGKGYRRTPVLSDTITYIVLNPSWHVPHKIAVQDKLPVIRQDPHYLIEQKIKVYKGWGADAVELDPLTIDWTQVTARNFPYRFRQEPGPQNALGRIKFMFPNKHSVYLHDTPAKELFEKTSRAFSSGCIRIRNPIELAEYLLKDNTPPWNREKIARAIEENNEQTVKLSRPVPVHLLYWTAWTDEEGTIHFRQDIYGRDKRLEASFCKVPPAAPAAQQ